MSKGKCLKKCTTLHATQCHSGQRLRALLKECRIGPSAFAEFLGVSPQCLTNWFMRGVPRARLGKLARLLTVDEHWLEEGRAAGWSAKAQSNAASASSGGSSPGMD